MAIKRSSHLIQAARSTQHGVHPIASFAFVVTVVHAVVALEAPNDQLNGLAPLGQAVLLLADPFGPLPVHDVHVWFVRNQLSYLLLYWAGRHCLVDSCIAEWSMDTVPKMQP